MRIGLYNARVGTFETGGTETFIREMAAQLSESHDVTIYTGAGSLVSPVEQLNVTVKQIPFVREDRKLNRRLSRFTPLHAHEIESISMYLSAWRSGVFERMANEVDVVSTHSLLDNALVSRTAPVPVVFRVAGIRRGSFRWRALLGVDQSAVRIANSDATADRLADMLGAATDGVVYAGLDLDQFSPTGPRVDSTDEDTILYLGRLDDGKGLFDLLEAHARLRETRRVSLWIVGEGELTEALKARSESLGTQEYVNFAGSVPHSEVQTYYRAADIYCLPSYSEGFPLGNIEAMACGLPVVSTDIEPVRKQITHEENGLLFEPGDVEALTGALERVLSSSSLQERLASAGRSYVQQLSWETQAEVFESYYERAVRDTA